MDPIGRPAKLSTRARHALDELRAVRDECERASAALTQHGFRHPAREERHRAAADAYETAGEELDCSLGNFLGMSALLNAEEAERVADAEELAP